jgi:adenosylhomocysteine nucleosidase
MIGFICALDAEVEGIKQLMLNKTEAVFAKIPYAKGEIFGQEVVCCECGVGKVNAAMSAQIMIDRYHPDLIINSGIAGSLSKEIRIGDLVIADDCVQHDMDGAELGDPLGQIQFNDELRTYLPADTAIADMLEKACAAIPDTAVFRGRIASGDVFIASRDRRKRIADTFNAIACEMEGAAIAAVCHNYDIPFVVIRCMSDKADGEAHDTYENMADLAADQSSRVVLRMLNELDAGQ